MYTAFNEFTVIMGMRNKQLIIQLISICE